MSRLADHIFKRSDWRMTSPFGMRRHPKTGRQTMHNGTDYATGGQNWPLHAIEDGTVTSTGFCSSRGNFVVVNYPRLGRETHLFHLQRVSVRQGQSVSRGTVIGTTGTTGASTGVHLHLGLRPPGGAWQDPHAFVYQPPTAAQQPTAPANLDALAREVIRGNWGNGEDRRRRLTAAGHDAAAVQARVNAILRGGT